MRPSFFARYSRWIIVGVVLLCPAVLISAMLAAATNRNDVKEWLPESFQETRDYHAFQQNFANDTFVLASWKGCTLDDPRLDKLVERLHPGRSDAAHPEEQDWFKKVVTGRGLVAQLTRPPADLSRTRAIDRLRGSLIGPDRNQTCAVIMLSESGKADLHATLRAVHAAAEECGVPREALHMGGSPVDNVAIDNEGQRMRLQLMALAGVIGLTMSYWCLRNWRLTAIVFLGSVYSAAISLAMVKWTGGTMNAILFAMPSVVYTGALCCAIHVVNYYRDQRAQHGLIRAPERGLKAAWLPCLLSAATTALGLVSLCTSELVPIRTFGLYSSIGMMAMVGLMYLYLPSALQLWPPPLVLETAEHSRAAFRELKHRGRMRTLARQIIARPFYIWAAFTVLVVVCGTGLKQAKTTVNLMSLFSPRAQIIDDYRWLEDTLGAMVPMEVVVRLDPAKAKSTLLERMELIDRLQDSIGEMPNVGSTTSTLTFMSDLSPSKARGLGGSLFNDSMRRNLLNKRLMAHRDDLERGDYFAVDPASGEELWRIHLRLPALADIDYGEFIHDVKSHVEPMLASERDRGVEGITGVTYTGLAPVVYRAERALLNGLVESFFWAFVMIGAIMSVVFRDLRAGIYTMLPNVWPVGVVFGAMSWAGIPLDIGALMTASVAMGVCVDDTVHFANWFRRSTELGLDRREAVVLAYEKSAGAIYQSTAIVAIGLVTFGLSNFMPTQRFGYLMFTLLCFGVAADLILTPAMLAGPIGRYFIKGCRIKTPILQPQAEVAEQTADLDELPVG